MMVSRYSKLPSPRACLLADWTAELVPSRTALAGLWPEWSGISAPCSRMVLATVLVWGTFECMTRPRRASSSDPASSLAPQSQAARGASLVAQARAVPGRSPDGVRLLSARPSAGLASLPGHTCLVLARSALFSLDSLASADPAPPGRLVASRVTRERPSTRSASGGRPGTPLANAGDRAGDSRPRAASILVSGPVTTLPHARRLSCGMIPPRNQESYVFPRRPSVLPTKNREGHNSLFHLEWYLHFSLLLIFIENGHIDLAYTGTPSAQDGNVDCLIVRPP